MMDMGKHGTVISSNSAGAAAVVGQAQAEADLRRGPWTVEEDLLLVNYIAVHGEGRWNSLAHSAGLKRSGKSCRLRWLNYLRPDVRRGNFTPEEQLLILELHSRWGNRWSKIAQHLPGRTDNEIKNYWRTRVQKLAKQLKCDVNSQQFKDAMRYLWIPRLMERIQAASAADYSIAASVAVTGSTNVADTYVVPAMSTVQPILTTAAGVAHASLHSSTPASCLNSPGGTSMSSPPVSSDPTDCYVVRGGDEFPAGDHTVRSAGGFLESLPSPCGYLHGGVLDALQSWWEVPDGFSSENLCSPDETWFLWQKL